VLNIFNIYTTVQAGA